MTPATGKTDATEVISVRIDRAAKKKLQEIAAKERRTFAEQYRLAIDEWLEKKECK